MDGVMDDDRIAPTRCEETFINGDPIRKSVIRCDFLKGHKGLHYSSGEAWCPSQQWWGITCEYAQEVERWTS